MAKMGCHLQPALKLPSDKPKSHTVTLPTPVTPHEHGPTKEEFKPHLLMEDFGGARVCRQVGKLAAKRDSLGDCDSIGGV